MKAMILAAGLGSRLRPLTDNCPKALVTVAGRTLLEVALARLHQAGVRRVIVNTHHHAAMVADYLRSHSSFGMHIEISEEPILLDTGGGLKNAASFFLNSTGNPAQPFFLHNVDVLSNIDLEAMHAFHRQHATLATLAVQQRPTSRQLLFNFSGELCGRRSGSEDPAEIVRPCAQYEALAFSGIHVISPALLNDLTEQGPFSIIDAYLRLSAEGKRVIAFRQGDAYWRDLGRPESILQAEQDVADGTFTLPPQL